MGILEKLLSGICTEVNIAVLSPKEYQESKKWPGLSAKNSKMTLLHAGDFVKKGD
jgi:hypothetical protein